MLPVAYASENSGFLLEKDFSDAMRTTNAQVNEPKSSGNSHVTYLLSGAHGRCSHPVQDIIDLCDSLVSKMKQDTRKSSFHRPFLPSSPRKRLLPLLSLRTIYGVCRARSLALAYGRKEGNFPGGDETHYMQCKQLTPRRSSVGGTMGAISTHQAVDNHTR